MQQDLKKVLKKMFKLFETDNQYEPDLLILLATNKFFYS